MAWTYTDGDGSDSVLGFISDPADRKELQEYFTWQLRYKQYRDAGYTDQQCHALASGWTLTADGKTIPQPVAVG